MTDAAVPVSAPAVPARPGCLVFPSVGLALVGVFLCGVGAESLARSGGIGAGLAAGRTVLLAPMVLAVVAAVLVLERLRPAERRPWRARGPAQDGAYFAVHVLAVVPFMTLLSAAFARLLLGVAPWARVPWTPRVPVWAVAAGVFVLMDAANWLAHWADHAWRPLWRLHALHHSQEELGVLTSFRAHPLSHLLGFMLAAVPPFVLLGNRGAVPVLISLYVCLGTVPHANLDWSYGRLGRVLVSPAYHRLHHAVDDVSGRNLGVVLTVWDVAARRARWPERTSRVTPTGLAGRPVPVEQDSLAGSRARVLLRQLAHPFVEPSSGGSVGGRLAPSRPPCLRRRCRG
jgi:sterol desaturase/sphingolipid hydroxylase (fatty acid hydroxylase superfamily)